MTFLKRNMPDPTGAKIGVCVKGCDSRTLVALLQEELVDKDKLYVVGVPCDGIVDRRKLEKMFSDEITEITFPQRGKVVVTTRKGETQELDQNTVLLETCGRCLYPNPVYLDDTAGPLEKEPDRHEVEPNSTTSPTTRTSPSDDKQSLLAEHVFHLRTLFSCLERLSGLLLLGQMREPVAAARNW